MTRSAFHKLVRSGLALGLSLAYPSGLIAAETFTKNKSAKRGTQVIVDPVRYEDMRQTVRVLGRLIARQKGPAVARTAGVIGSFRVAVGDPIQKGDVIAVLMKNRLQWQHNLQKARFERDSAQVKTKKREIALLRQELKRLNSLKSSPAFSQARLEDKRQEVSVAESTVAEANAQLRMANANLQLTAISLNDAEIRAPYSGIISKRNAEVGSFVGIGSPVATIINNRAMEIEADIPARRLSSLAVNMVISAELANKHRFKAAVRAIIPDENPRTRTRAVRLRPIIDLNSSVVAINQSVTLFVPAGTSEKILTVHKDAVIIKKGKRVAFVADDKIAKMRVLELGQANGSRFIVNGGLNEGELVVIRGNERLRPGAQLTFKMQKSRQGTTPNNASKGPTGSKK